MKNYRWAVGLFLVSLSSIVSFEGRTADFDSSSDSGLSPVFLDSDYIGFSDDESEPILEVNSSRVSKPKTLLEARRENLTKKLRSYNNQSGMFQVVSSKLANEGMSTAITFGMSLITNRIRDGIVGFFGFNASDTASYDMLTLQMLSTAVNQSLDSVRKSLLDGKLSESAIQKLALRGTFEQLRQEKSELPSDVQLQVQRIDESHE